MIEIRKLAAVDLAFLGPWIILPEFALGVLRPPALGALTLRRSESWGWTAFGLYLLTLSLNYVPMLLAAIQLVRRGAAHGEIADEAGDRRLLSRKYRRQSLWLLVPLVVPVVALTTGLGGRD
jgi:hypothetical protein